MDAFGLPNELAAMKRKQAPASFTGHWIRIMCRTLRGLGISYDWSRVVDTSDPGYYRWTQALFLELLRMGLVERREADVPRCPRCETTLARMQVDRGRCWRCGAPVEDVRRLQWYVLLSRFSEPLREGVEGLDGWSPAIRKLLLGFIGRDSTGRGEGWRVRDWMVSRQRSWGTPIPAVHCNPCGVVPVPEEDLPIRLPDDLDWSRGSGALASCAEFMQAACPRCGRPAERDGDTLDCYFADIWCFLAAPAVRDGVIEDPFSVASLARWMPVDCFHSGQDTFLYLHLHRFLGALFNRQGLLQDPEPISRHTGYAMVVAGGRKMSTHLGNALSVGKLLRRHGADTLRVAVLWAGNPQRTLAWNPEWISRAESFMAQVREFIAEQLPDVSSAVTIAGELGEAPSRSAAALLHAAGLAAGRIDEFIRGVRPNAALQEIFTLFMRIRRYAAPRLGVRPLSAADGRTLGDVLSAFAVVLAPFAPRLAEESWHGLDRQGFVSLASWPDAGMFDPDRVHDPEP